MSLKFFHGTGIPPPFVSDISVEPKGGLIRIRYAESSIHDLRYSSNYDLANKVEILVRNKLPFASAQSGAGPAEVVEMLIAMDKLDLIPPFIRISWSGPDEWEMREMKEDEKEWVPAVTQEEISSRRFLPAWVV